MVAHANAAEPRPAPAGADASSRSARDVPESGRSRGAPAATPSEDGRPLYDYIFFRASHTVSHEQAQGLARIFITGLTALLLFPSAALGTWSNTQAVVLYLVCGYLVLSVPYYLFVRRFPDRFLWRRSGVIASDLGLVSLGTYLFGLGGLAFYPLYLWVVVGNGLRHGSHFLQVATATGVSGFVMATVGNGTWMSHPGVTAGLLVGLTLMPKFILGLIGRLEEVNEQLRAKVVESEHLATHDILTGLPNRVLLQDRLARALDGAHRHGTALAVAFIDIDGFKAVNDNFGHDTGDELLRRVAACLAGATRSTDTVARIGGDEFLVLMEDCGDVSQAAALVEKVSACAGRDFVVRGRETFVSWSCGVALYPRDGRDLDTLLRNADTAMTRARAAGGNQFRFYDPAMSDEVNEQLQLRDDLRRAIRDQQLLLYYQPQVDLATGAVIGSEALVRWAHPSRGLLSPDSFIPAAERCALVLPLGRWVLEQVARDMADWIAAGLPTLKVSLNVSGRQLLAPDFVETLETTLRRTGVPPERLLLEVTESVLLEDHPRLEQVVDSVRSLGVRLALDDFGKGYSSLSYLKRFPFDVVKIDRAFVSGLPHDRSDRAVVEAVLGMARGFDLAVVAEGVENDAQAAWLREAGCPIVQGYRFGQPMPLAELRRLVGRDRRVPHLRPVPSVA